jgi:hypothetical protein
MSISKEIFQGIVIKMFSRAFSVVLGPTNIPLTGHRSFSTVPVQRGLLSVRFVACSPWKNAKFSQGFD